MFLCTLLSPSWLSVCVVGMTVAVGVGMETVTGVTIGRILARGVALLPGEGVGLLLGDGVLGVGRMLAVGGSDRLELKKKTKSKKWLLWVLDKCIQIQSGFCSLLPSPVLGRTQQTYLSLVCRSGLITHLSTDTQW